MGLIYDAMHEDASVTFCISVEESIENIKINSIMGYIGNKSHIRGINDESN